MNSEVMTRQLLLLYKLINDYRTNSISLNQMIMKIEGILALDEMKEVWEAIYQKINLLEEINASLFEGKILLQRDKDLINETLTGISIYIDRMTQS